MLPRLKLLLSLFLLVLVTGEALHAQDQAPRPPAKDWKGEKAHKVIRVIDGDTVVIALDGKETRVRLIGVDTPETVHPTKPVEFYGKEASRFTTNLLQGESVFVEYDQQKVDKYGRTLAYLYRAPDGLFVNLEIIRQGYGHAYTKYPFKQQYMDLFRHYEGQAREAKRGLWGEAPPAPQGKVYVTRTGAKYHAEGCRSKIPISLEEAKKKYGPCSVCNPPP